MLGRSMFSIIEQYIFADTEALAMRISMTTLSARQKLIVNRCRVQNAQEAFQNMVDM